MSNLLALDGSDRSSAEKADRGFARVAAVAVSAEMTPVSSALLGLVHSGDCTFDGRTYSHGAERTDSNGRKWQCWNGQWLANAPGPIQASL